MKMPGHHKLFVVGELGRHYFVSQGHEIEQNFQYTVQKPNLSRARIISETLMEQFNNGRAGRSVCCLYANGEFYGI